MTTSITMDYWKALGGGLRSSTLLRLGAVLVVLSVIADVVTRLLGRFEVIDIHNMFFLVPWISWIVTLLVLGVGFIVTGYRPYLGRMGWVVGTFHIGHALDLFTIIFATPGMTIAPGGMALAKYLTLILFAVAEQDIVGRKMRNLLFIAAGLQCVKISTRTLWGLDPQVSLALDMALLLLLAVAYWRLGSIIAKTEQEWAKMRLEERSATFDDFNNPEQQWD